MIRPSDFVRARKSSEGLFDMELSRLSCFFAHDISVNLARFFRALFEQKHASLSARITKSPNRPRRTVL